ncbi:hypothetical protein ASE38_17160 [Cellulomonas sp. Root930]|nr:hypothetical protein ASE38_17160 [Cellulomonas sp. Root930]
MSRGILIEVTMAASIARHIRPVSMVIAALEERLEDIEAANREGWGRALTDHLQVVELAFGVSLTAETGVVISEVSAKAPSEEKFSVARRAAEV